MQNKKRLSTGEILFLLGLGIYFVWALPTPILSQASGDSTSAEKNTGRIEVSIKDLPTDVRESLQKIDKRKNLYWKKAKKAPEALSGSDMTGGRSLSGSDWNSYPNFLNNAAIDRMNSEQYNKAIKYLNRALQRDRLFILAYYNRGLAYALNAEYEQAISDFTTYLRHEKNDVSAYYNRGMTYLKDGQYDKALADLNKTLDLQPKDAQVYYLRGFLYYKKGEDKLAQADYQKAKTLDPDFVKKAGWGKDELDTYASHLKGKKPVSDAATDLQDDKPFKQQALAHVHQREYDQALSELNQAIQIDPKDAESYNNRGSTYTLKGQYKEAISDFDKAIKLNPRYAKAYYNRGLAYYYLENYLKAVTDLALAIELNPKDAEAYHNRGLAYDQLGQTERAVEDFNMAIVLKPDLADAYFNKAVALERGGFQGEAREAYQAFLKHAPPGAAERIAQVRKKLEK
jgi:tetratricopeptide (TPR) repeat protein